MRTLMRVTIPVEPGSAAIRDGRLPQILEATLQRLKPEAAYFYPERGRRTALVVFDLKDPSELPAISEPLFQGLGASVEMFPVMNLDDLRAGLRALDQGAERQR